MTNYPKPVPFSALTIKVDKLINRITLPIEISKGFDPKQTPEKFFQGTALLDTGATNSVITLSAAKTIGLTPTGTKLINHAGGKNQCNTYLVNFKLPNKVGIACVEVSECSDEAGNFQAIIGMDIISMGDLSISSFDKKTCVSFRIPSYHEYDFVKESIRIQYPGVKLYAACPCGTKDKFGKPVKFSDCHGKLLK